MIMHVTTRLRNDNKELLDGCWHGGLGNRYEYIYALIRDFQNLKFTLNGGIVSVHQVGVCIFIHPLWRVNSHFLYWAIVLRFFISRAWHRFSTCLNHIGGLSIWTFLGVSSLPIGITINKFHLSYSNELASFKLDAFQVWWLLKDDPFVKFISTWLVQGSIPNKSRRSLDDLSMISRWSLRWCRETSVVVWYYVTAIDGHLVVTGHRFHLWHWLKPFAPCMSCVGLCDCLCDCFLEFVAHSTPDCDRFVKACKWGHTGSCLGVPLTIGDCSLQLSFWRKWYNQLDLICLVCLKMVFSGLTVRTSRWGIIFDFDEFM